MNCYPLFRVRSWNNGMRCMSLYSGTHQWGSTKTNVMLNDILRIKCLYTRHIISGIWVYKTSAIFPLHITVNSILLHLLLRSSTITGRWHFKRALDPCNLVNQIHTTPLITQYTPNHDDVIKWKHFPHYWPFVWGIHRSPVNSPHKGRWRGALVVFFDLRMNKQLSKQSWGWWFETPSRPLWHHCNDEFETRMSGKCGVNVLILLCVLIDINLLVARIHIKFKNHFSLGNRTFNSWREE